MTNFINNLIDDHKTMLTLLKKCKNAKLDKKTQHLFIKTVEVLLTDHLHIENTKLYPELKNMATGKIDAIATIEEFSTGMDKIGNIIAKFFNEDSNTDNINMNSDLSKIILLLEVRIKKEEDGLYTLYEDLISKK